MENDGSVYKVLHYGIGIGGEESFYQLLSANVAGQPANYKISLVYYNPNNIVSDVLRSCLSANIQFSIEPLEFVRQNAINYLTPICTAGQNVLPDDVFANNTVFTNQQTVSYSKSGFQVYPSNTNGDKLIWEKYFSVEALATEIVELVVEIDYRFLIGDLSLVLEYSETGNFSNYLCNRVNEICYFGENQYNENRLNVKIASGKYRLSIYEPVSQNATVSPCSAFEFSLKLKFNPKYSEIYNCRQSSILPISFNQPGFIRSSGDLHFVEKLLLSSPSYTYFNLDKDSLFRFSSSVSSVGGIISGIFKSYYNQTTGLQFVEGSETHGNKETLFTNLTSGSYLLLVAGFSSNADPCHTEKLEISITAIENIPKLPAVTCPSNGVDLVPFFPDVLPNSFNYSSSSTLYTFRSTKGNVWSYRFNVTQSSIISSSVSSSYSLYDLTLILSNSQTSDYGTNSYNKNKIYREVDVGEYEISIHLPFNYSLPNFRCIPFDFQFEIYSNAPSSEEYIDKMCEGFGENLFDTTNSNRFLNVENEVNYQSNSFLVPRGFQLYTSRRVNISVNSRSAFRIYTAPHAQIDIDLALYSLVDGDSKLVTVAGNGFYGEETMVATLEVGDIYQVKVSFYSWNGGTNSPSDDPCILFDMQFDISPLNTHVNQTICPNQVSHWPLSFPSGLPFESPYTYSNDKYGESFYYQQQYQNLVSKTYNFTLEDYSNIYVDLSYHFSYGDLMMRLENTLSNQVVSYGENSYNGNSLRVTRLEKGSYALIIYEVAQNKDIIGCSHFNFYLSVERDSSFESENSAINVPASFNSISFLPFDGTVHLDDKYSLNSHSNFIEIKPPKDSMLRIEFQAPNYLETNSLFVLVKLYNDSNSQLLQSQMNLLSYEISSTTTYHLSFNYYPNNQTSSVASYQPFHLQLSIEPISYLSAQVENYPISGCNVVNISSFSLSPTGYLSINEILSFPSTLYPGTNQEYVVTSFKFTTYTRSVFFLAVESNFLLDDLKIKIEDMKKNVLTWGKMEYDINYIDRVFDSGDYYLTIYSSSSNISPDRCVMYQFSSYIRPYKVDSPHIDCSDFDTLPYDLSSTTG